jgi:mannose-6-phosphate isomerase-like protein (cupin superfamily)
MDVINYGGQRGRVLAGLPGPWSSPDQGFAMVEMTVPAGFGGPVPHVHHGFDEGFYVLDGELVVLDGTDEITVSAGSLAVAPRGCRHAFRNPSASPVRILGIWTPPSGLELIVDLGAVLAAGGPPDPAVLADVYRRHNSELVP